MIKEEILNDFKFVVEQLTIPKAKLLKSITNITDFITSQSNTPTAEEIIKELDELSTYKWEFEDKKYPCFQTNTKIGNLPKFFIEFDGNISFILDFEEGSYEDWERIHLPLSLAYKITIFFMNRNDE